MRKKVCLAVATAIEFYVNHFQFHVQMQSLIALLTSAFYRYVRAVERVCLT